MLFSVEEGFPTIKGDGRYCSFVSQYNNTFHGAWSRASQPAAKVTQQKRSAMSHHGLRLVKLNTAWLQLKHTNFKGNCCHRTNTQAC